MRNTVSNWYVGICFQLNKDNLLKNKTEKGCAMDDKSHSFMLTKGRFFSESMMHFSNCPKNVPKKLS